MKVKLFSAVVLLVAFLVALVQPISASTWYVYNYRTSSYGVQADISTPNDAPYLGDPDGESNWVSTLGDYWVQTGWLYYSGSQYALPYVEYNTNSDYDLTTYGTQDWYDFKNYKIYYYNGGWLVYIDGEFEIGIFSNSLPTPPTTLMASSEVHDSSSTELYTVFQSVKWMNSSGTWNYFDQNNFHADSPYAYNRFYDWWFLNYGP